MTPVPDAEAQSTAHESFGKIDRKLAASFGAVLLLLMLTAMGVASYQFVQLQRQEENQLVSTIARILSESISRISFSGKHHARLLAQEMLAQTPTLAYISVESTNGLVLAHSDPAFNEIQDKREDVPANMSQLRAGEYIVTERDSTNGLVKEVLVPYRGGFDNHIEGLVRVGVLVHHTRQHQRAILYMLLSLVAILTAAAMAAVYWLSRRFGGEVRALAWQLKSVLAHAPFAMAIMDRTGRMRVRSTELERMFGSPPGDGSLAGMIARSFGPEVARRFEAMDQQVFAQGASVEEDLEMGGGAKHRVWQVSKSPIARNSKGEVTLNFTLIRDVSSQRQLEAQLRQSQKMDAVGHLAGGIAHDFNNKLQAILGYLDITLSEMEADNPWRGNMVEIQQAAQHSALLTHQLLAYARKQVASPQVLDLNSVVEGMLKMLGRLIGENIRLAWHPGRNLWAVKMDPSQLDQVLTNLILNARDAISETGQIQIETANVLVDELFRSQNPELAPGEYALLAVSDTGSGMDKATQAMIFEPFFTTKEVGKGSGLGLATVYGIIKQNHGFIDVASEPGKGTLFRIYLPRCASVADPKAAAPAAPLPAGRGETVLLVEDERSLLSLCNAMLVRLGYEVLSAQSPAQAIELASHHSRGIDLLLSDVIMPEMNGLELAQRIVATQPRIKCLFMSGYGADVIGERDGRVGWQFLPKPFSALALAEKLRATMDSPECDSRPFNPANLGKS